MTSRTTKPFLLTRDEEGHVRLTLRELRHNSQNYPYWVSSLCDERFETVRAARDHAKERYGASAGQFANEVAAAEDA
jgi:hypothetical protein